MTFIEKKNLSSDTVQQRTFADGLKQPEYPLNIMQ